MAKYIHYCWFGDQKKPKISKKCIKSWKKYLPGFKLIEWSEKNIDLEECPFIKEAYQKKKWAFVADYARAKILKEYGGLYFDTDMEVIKNITDLLNNDTFLGVEDSGFVAAGVWWEKEKNAYLPTQLLEYYKSMLSFSEDLYSITIPKLLTGLLYELGYKRYIKDVQKLEKDITIYPREYFYPYSYRRDDNIFTDKTCMIHYYDASWTPNWEQRELKIHQILGDKNGTRFIRLLHYIKKVATLFLFPIIFYRKKKREKAIFKEQKKYIDEEFENLQSSHYLVIYNRRWLGIANSSKEIFENCIAFDEFWDNNLIKYFSYKTLSSQVKTIIFSGFCRNFAKILENIKCKINIKVLWHGSNAVHTENYDWEMFKLVMELLKNKKITSIGFVKKSMYELYKSLGYNVEFVMNNVKIKKKPAISKPLNESFVRIGIYASGDRWVKNFYNQLAAASLIENALVDIIPISKKTLEYCDLLKIRVEGSQNVSRDELLKRLSKNDINLYVTFVECAPITPLESLELGVLCITSNNHHYWEGTELEKYLIINQNDNAMVIAEKINFCLKNKEKIITIYKKWKKQYDLESEKNIKMFLNGDK